MAKRFSQAEYLKALRETRSPIRAAQAVNRHYQTIQSRRRSDDGFKAAEEEILAELKEERKRKAESNIFDRVYDGDYRASLDYLERHYPEEWGKNKAFVTKDDLEERLSQLITAGNTIAAQKEN